MTLFQFDTTVPATNDNPSADQPDMLVNNQSINGILGVDHVTFNLNNGGQHTAITFNQDASYVPSAFPVSPPKLFTNTVDGAGNALPSGVPELFFYSGSAVQSKNQYVSQPVGSVLLPGGIIMKWGAVAGVTDGTAITFGVAFPNNVFSLQVSGGTSSSPQPTINFSQSTLTTSGFTAKITGTQPVNLYYIAIGN